MPPDGFLPLACESVVHALSVLAHGLQDLGDLLLRVEPFACPYEAPLHLGDHPVGVEPERVGADGEDRVQPVERGARGAASGRAYVAPVPNARALQGVAQDDLESLISGPDRPTALFMDLALKSQVKVLEMIHAMGLSIPGDISVIGYDAMEIRTVEGLQLAAVKQPFEQVAREIARHITIRNDGRFEMTIAQHFLPGQTLARIETP